MRLLQRQINLLVVWYITKYFVLLNELIRLLNLPVFKYDIIY